MVHSCEFLMVILLLSKQKETLERHSVVYILKKRQVEGNAVFSFILWKTKGNEITFLKELELKGSN
jgi:hypothetical protein